MNCRISNLTLILLTWRIWWAPNNVSKWQMGFNLAFKVLIRRVYRLQMFGWWVFIFPHTIKRTNSIWIGHILCRICRIKHIIEGKIEERTEVTGRRGIRRKQLRDDLKEKKSYWHSEISNEKVNNAGNWQVGTAHGQLTCRYCTRTTDK